MKNLITLSGKKPGPTSIVMAGNHGNEICGIRAFEKIIPKIKVKSGTVIFVLGNPRAIKKNVRFTEFNLNRAFLPAFSYSEEIKKTYEYKRAQKLKRIFDQGEALLDIHSTLNPGEPCIICEENALEIISGLPKDFKRIVYGFDALEPGASDGYMLSKGKIGICMECGQHDNPKTITVAVNAVNVFLKIRGHVDSRPKSKHNRQFIKMDFFYRTKTDSFLLDRKFYDFELIAKGTTIGVDGEEILKAHDDCVIVFAHDCQKIGAEAYFLGHVTNE